jgi:hypothetical protein
MFDGFVVELDSNNAQDTFKYRGEIVRRVGLWSTHCANQKRLGRPLNQAERYSKLYIPARNIHLNRKIDGTVFHCGQLIREKAVLSNSRNLTRKIDIL